MSEFKFAGQLRGNPSAGVNNVWKIPVDVTAQSSQDTLAFTVPTGIAVTGFTFQGVLYALTGCTVETVSAIKSQIYAIISGFECAPVLKVSYVGGIFNLKHVGGGVLSSVSFGDTPEATTRLSGLQVNCNYLSRVVDTVSNVVIDGTSTAVANSPFAYTGNSNTDSATALRLKTEIEAALTTATAPFTCTVATDDVQGVYIVTLYGISTSTISVGGKVAIKTEFQDVFVAGVSLGL